MPTYQVLTKSFINNRIYEEGETVELDNSIEAGDNLKLLSSKTKNKPVDTPNEDV